MYLYIFNYKKKNITGAHFAFEPLNFLYFFCAFISVNPIYPERHIKPTQVNSVDQQFKLLKALILTDKNR